MNTRMQSSEVSAMKSNDLPLPFRKKCREQKFFLKKGTEREEKGLHLQRATKLQRDRGGLTLRSHRAS